MIRRYIDLVEAALASHYDPQAIYLHGGPQELQGQRLKRYGKDGGDAGALFFCRDTPVGRWYAATYSKGRVWTARIHIPVDEILDLTNPAHRARLKAAVSPQEYAYMTTETASGHMDWAVVDEDILIELGFRGAVFQERPAGMPTGLPPDHPLANLPDHVLSVAVFDAADVELIGYLDEPLMEAKTLDAETPNKTPFKVWVDPSHRELVVLAQRHPLRTLSTPEHYFVWDANRMVHHVMAGYLERHLGYPMVEFRSGIVTTPTTNWKIFGADPDSYPDWNPDVERDDIKFGMEGVMGDGGYEWPTTRQALGLDKNPIVKEEAEPPFKKPKGVRTPAFTKDGRRIEFRKTYLGVLAYIDGEQAGYLEIDCPYNNGYENQFVIRRVWVNEPFRRQGVATAMYDYAWRAGFRPLKGSKSQTDGGKAIWKKHLDRKAALGIDREYHRDYPNRFNWRPLSETAQPGISLVDLNSIGYDDEPDEFLYHVTSEPNAQAILSQGFQANRRRTFSNYGFNTQGRVFFTERGGVRYWANKVEDHLFDQYDDPPEVAVLRVPRDSLGDLHPDAEGTNDSREPCYYITESFQQTIPFHWVDHSEEDVKLIQAHFQIGEGHFVVQFKMPYYNPGYWELQFTRNNKLDLSQTGNAMLVLSTVMQAVREFIAAVDPPHIIFHAANTEPSRAKLYPKLTAMMQKEFPQYVSEPPKPGMKHTSYTTSRPRKPWVMPEPTPAPDPKYSEEELSDISMEDIEEMIQQMEADRIAKAKAKRSGGLAPVN